MLNEPATEPEYMPAADEEQEPGVKQQDELLDIIRDAVSRVLLAERELAPGSDTLRPEDTILLRREGTGLLVSFEGQLKYEATQAYEELDTLLAPHGLLPLFRERKSLLTVRPIHVVHVLQGRYPPHKPGRPWLNLFLLLATIFSTLITGALGAIGEIGLEDPRQAAILAENFWGELWRGFPYAFSILLILGTHEMGHYLMMLRHRVAATLPYFIPLPFLSPFGTLGAVIMLRGPIRSRRVLLDVGAAGPLAGLVVAIPVLLIGLATSPVVEPVGAGILEGNSLLYAAAKIITFGQMLPDGQVDVMLNQLAWAGWTGLFVTALNLIPLGQLDGGHVLYALLGERARLLYWPLLVAMVLLGLFVSQMWLLLWLLLLLFGRFYAVPLDDITQLDGRRRAVALLTAAVFVLVFVPVPLSVVEHGSGLPDGQQAGMILLAALVLLRRGLRAGQ